MCTINGMTFRAPPCILLCFDRTTFNLALQHDGMAPIKLKYTLSHTIHSLIL